ncbi:MAG TPA: hypothetical protein VM580_17725, partial [Labilithrix sp.]|nr:hypothetical protein [Labilithrix sp.]
MAAFGAAGAAPADGDADGASSFASDDAAPVGGTGGVVVTPYTALLVLETDQDYARFGIARRGLANVLSVQNGKLVALSRSLPKAASPEGARQAPFVARDDA